MADQALSDVKVIDLTYHIGGPFCTKLLADYGADVIKIENPDGGDIARRKGPFPGDIPHPEKSGTFLYLNTNKRGMTLNLETNTGRNILKELVKDADILVENFEPKKMQEWGLTYDTLKEVNPRLIMTSISNFGQWGPYRDFKATEIVIAGMGGPMIATGKAGREPLKYYDSASACQVAFSALIATLANLRHVRKTGTGQHIDVSMFEALLSSVNLRGQYILEYQYSGRTETRRQTETPAGSILSALGVPCKDGFVQFTALTVMEPWFSRFARWIGHPELLEDPQMATVDLRMGEEQGGILDALGRAYCLDHTKAELMKSMLEHSIAGGCVNTVADVVADPQMQAREFFVEVDHPVAGKFRYPGSLFRPSQTPWCVRRPAPTLGEHNEEVYCDRLGYSKQDLVRLRQQNII